MKTIKLTDREFEVFQKHWNRNIEFGWDGTFGGYDDEDKEYKKECLAELKIAEAISKKLDNN